MLIATLTAWLDALLYRLKGLLVGVFITAFVILVRLRTGKWPDDIGVS